MEYAEKLTAPIFSGLLPSELDYLLSTSDQDIFEPGKIIIHEGDTGQDFFVILEGKVEVSKKDKEPEEKTILTTLEPGTVIGEISVITKNPRTATITAIEKTTLLAVDINRIKQDPNGQPIYEKLMQNLGTELSKKLVYFENKVIEYDEKSQNQYLAKEDISKIAPTSIVALLGWQWIDIMHEIPFLAKHGYDAIKISPPQEFVIKKGDPWWTIYQPVSYKPSSFYGSEEELIKMIDFAHGYNLKIYADLLLNHMAEFNPDDESHVGTEGTTFDKYKYGPLNKDNDYYEYNDFYHFKDEGNKSITDEDYSKLEGVWHLEHYDFLNLPKLNLKHQHVIEILRKYAKYLLSLGIDGFRIDATKHLHIKSVEKILAGLKTHDRSQPFIYQEYYTGASMGIDVYSFMEKYFKVGYVTTFEYGGFLADAIKNQNNDLQKLVEYSFGSSWLHYPENRAVTVIDNHDTERMMPNMLNYKDSKNNAYILGYIFMLAWPFGVPQIMSSFKFQGHNNPLPKTRVWQNGKCTALDPGSPWVVQHRWNAIANMVLFHKETLDAPGIAHVWTNGGQIAFARVKQKLKEYITSVGFVVINNSDQPLKREFETGLPDGEYHDLIHSNFISGKIAGPTFTVKNYGKASIEIKPFDAVVIKTNKI